MKCIRIIVEGTVQGVFFRATCKKKADELEIRGYAKNLKDSTVEITALGEDTFIKQFTDFLSSSPGSSKVRNMKITYIPPAYYRGFEIR